MIALTLPIPVSTNKLFFNVPGVGRVKTRQYRNWIGSAGWTIQAQRPEKIKGPVAITISVPRSSRADISNLIKATEDLLVRHQVIEGDGPKIVRSCTVTNTEPAPETGSIIVTITEWKEGA
ncbi:MAG: hypothetical protein H0T60_10275 [Acidobacteria bacterium]|nr:hypothetical protein [Acidobacteriota bacterium]